MAGMNFDSAKNIINGGLSEAQELLNDKNKVNDLVTKVENLIKKIPIVGNNFSGIPTMISMLKCYITKEYQGTSLKTIAIIVSAFIYIVKENDIISDKKGIVGYVDDLVVANVAMKMIKGDLDKFRQWKADNNNKTE